MQPYNDDLVNDCRPSLSFYIYFTFLPLKSRRHKKKWKEEKEIGGKKIKKKKKEKTREGKRKRKREGRNRERKNKRGERREKW